MPSTLSAHEKQISQIFSREFVFNIPGYQRPYSWTKDQAGELFDDLISFMRDRPQTAVSEMPPYFLGSIVLIKADTSPDADVVDGQQRLTTITILLSVLRANIQSEEGEAITNLIYEKGQTILGTQDHFRLTLRPRDKEFFKKYVQRSKDLTNLISLEQDISDTQTRIRDNARLFQDRISSLKDAERIRFAEFIVTRCFLVVVSTPDLDSAYRIFSVMNSRGLDLSATDILKAEIIGKISEDERPDYTQKWEEIEEDLGRDSFVDLFSQIRMVYRKAKSQGTLLKEFQEHVSSTHTPKDLIDDVIAPMARVYAELVDEAYTSTEFAEEINQLLRWLNRFEFSDWMPPAIAFSMRNRHDPKKMRAFFRDLERLAFWILLTRAGVNERIDRFSRLTRDIESGIDLHGEKSSLQLTPKEKTDTKTVLSGPIYDLLPARARSIVMLRLDSLVSGGGATYDYPTITVEHVLPQNPVSNSLWITWFPDQNQRILLTHRLGNLALLTRKKNSAASNFEFDRKKKAYFSNNGVSPFPITTQVLQHTDWTPKIVEERQNELIAVLDTHWRLSEALA